MITQPGTRPQFLHCNDVVVTIGGGDSHFEMVDAPPHEHGAASRRASAPASATAAQRHQLELTEVLLRGAGAGGLDVTQR